MTEVLFTGNSPDYAHQGDAGADLVADSDYIVGYGMESRTVTRVQGKESECEECTEAVET